MRKPSSFLSVHRDSSERSGPFTCEGRPPRATPRAVKQRLRAVLAVAIVPLIVLALIVIGAVAELLHISEKVLAITVIVVVVGYITAMTIWLNRWLRRRFPKPPAT